MVRISEVEVRNFANYRSAMVYGEFVAVAESMSGRMLQSGD